MATTTIIMLVSLVPAVIVFFLANWLLDKRTERKHAKLIEDGLRRHTGRVGNVMPALALGVVTWGVVLTALNG